METEEIEILRKKAEEAYHKSCSLHMESIMWDNEYERLREEIKQLVAEQHQKEK